MQIRVGIIGAGTMGRTHAANLANDARVKLAGVTDLVADKASTFAQTFSMPAFADVETLLDAVDALYVTTPNTQHVSVTLAALRHNIHVFCEKPMATSLADAQQILQATETSSAVYQVGHNRRFAPVYRYLKEQVEQGFVPYLTNAKQNDGDWLNPPWITDLSLTGGFLYESTVHLLDLLRWLLGEVVAVQARAQTNVYNVLNDFAILLTFEQKRLAVLSSSAHASWASPFEHVEIVGDHALMRTEELGRVLHAPGLEQAMMLHDFSQLPRAKQWGYEEEDQAFISACLGQAPPPVTAEDGYRSIELCEACYRSAAQEGAEIRLPLALE